MTAKADHDKHEREERERREKEKHQEAQRRDQERQQVQGPPQPPDDFQSEPHPEGTVLREGPEGPRPGTPRQAPAPGDVIIGSPGVGEEEMTRRQMERHPDASDEIINAPFAQPVPQPDHGLGTEGRRLAEERMGRGHVPNDPPPPLPRIKVDESPKFPEDLSARDARETEKVSTGGATQQQNQVYAGQVRPEDGRANLDVNTPKGEHLLGRQDTDSRLPRPPLMAGSRRDAMQHAPRGGQERRDDPRASRNAVPDDTGRDQRSGEPDPGRGARHRDEKRP
jgi:hypothetical protein